VFLGPFLAGAGPDELAKLVPEAVECSTAYLEAGADCVYPIGLWEPAAVHTYISQVERPVNVIRLPQGLSVAELAELGVARVSWGPLLQHTAIAQFADQLASLRD
jgi:2-methylisocitrate lyase-like PEP mutase family enzyme